ncbi:DUF5807 family protein [Haloarculaceae archaeon H-GB2-1]|nr:DUF5807 family protein [Haloarculaceae archaeon H-GB1-1]MEA5385799.1 DUF5807 family protein [Haloarculaceae archaeon H-GB11]MEA5407299.1 DUF5807 family protein [Haloarculaceae archaeon H-GB2-1]
MSDRAEFLAGDRPDDVHIFLARHVVSNPDALAAQDYGEKVDGGIVLVLPGDEARGSFRNATGIDVMGFAQEAMGTEGDIDGECITATCPEAEGEEDHHTEFIFAFAEEQNEEVGGIYAEGDVIHAYASCSCGASYSDKWNVEE